MKFTKSILYKLFFISLTLFVQNKLSAQCTTGITAFPYTESFETNNGNWVPGGTASDWAWGTPIKPVINAAANGTRCWIVGTLTQSSYSNNQNSTLTSPCFNFSTLTAPYIKFKLFWETEKKYDGASFQYSIDGGTSWTTLGSYADFLNCPNDNWFNTNGITTLGSDGWSGNIQPTAACAGGAGNGSGVWKLAQHEMFNLAGQANVKFRFRFAAGSVCNNYDGFAVDDIWVGEYVYKTSNFNYTCANSNSVNFVPEGSACNMYTWDFGDPASGSNNTSSTFSPTHVFSGPGIYSVSCTLQIGTLVPPVTKQVIITDVNTVVLSPLNCYGDKATLQAVVNPVGNYSYLWNSTPPQTTAIATNLGAGTYTVNVSGNNVCPNSDNLTLLEPPQLKTYLGNDTTFCPGQQLVLNPGTFASYLWQDNSTAQNFTVTQTGKYSVTVTNGVGCTATDSISIVVDCSDVFFPDAFTPNGDGLNDGFGPLGNLTAINKYSFKVYNRWGQLVFQSNNPLLKWNGKTAGKISTSQSFVWFAEYILQASGIKRQQKGVITIIR